jgi:uncharacterized hydrophobic protein (TIGR00271 family)
LLAIVEQTVAMLRLQVFVPADLTDDVAAIFEETAAVSGLAVMRGVAVRPQGDLVLADVAREAANGVIDQLRELGVHRRGSIQVEQVNAWLSQEGLDAEVRTPGASADAVVWVDVTHRAYADSELNWTYLSFMSLATLIASIAIILDSQVLVIGAMVLGPEFGPIAALGVALVRRRYHLLRMAARTLIAGFVIAIAFTMLAALVGRGLGWVEPSQVTGPRPLTAFIYTPDKWSLIVAIIAAAAGVLSLTSERVGGLSGVFISVTTVPAAGNIGLGLAFGAWHEVWGSALMLTINLTAMALAGWATLAMQQFVWRRVAARRRDASDT